MKALVKKYYCYSRGQYPTPVNFSFIGFLNFGPMDSFSHGVIIGCCVTVTAISLIVPTYSYLKTKFFKTSSSSDFNIPIMEQQNNIPIVSESSNTTPVTITEITSSDTVHENANLLLSHNLSSKNNIIEAENITIIDGTRLLNEQPLNIYEVSLNVLEIESMVYAHGSSREAALSLFIDLISNIINMTYDTAIYLKDMVEVELQTNGTSFSQETIISLNSFLDTLNLLIISF